MANEKMNTVGTKKAMIILMLSDGKCFDCGITIQFKGFNVSHIIPQKFYVDNALPINNELSNLVALCETCNKRMRDANGWQYFSAEKIAYLELRNAQIARASNPNDVRTILNLGLLSTGNNKIDRENSQKFCDAYAKENPHSKFAKIHQNGRFYQKRIV